MDCCIVVDVGKQEIIDSEEKKPMRLFKYYLHASGGVDAVELYIAEVRELYQCPKGKQN